MKKNSSQLISAISIGLSAFMALSTPMSAFAAEVDTTINPAPADPPTSTESSTEAPSTHQEEIQEIVEQIPEVTEAVSEVQDTAGEIETPVVTEEQAGAISAPAVEEANNDAASLVDTSEMATVNQDLTDVKTELQTAVTEDKKADNAAQDMVDSLDAAEDMAGKINDDVTDAAQKIADITQQMQSAETADDVKEIYEQVEQVITDTTADVGLKEQAFESLVTQYGNAKTDLLKAEENYQKALSDAALDAGEAKQILDDMTERVDALEEAVDKAGNLLDKEAASAKAITDQKKITTVDWNKQRNFMYSIVRNYYIPQLVDPAATNIVIYQKTPGFDKQDNNYTKVTYTDGNGATKTLYFNYDRVDKVLNEADRYNTTSLGKELDIVVFTKEQDEIEADAHIKQYYASQNLSDAAIKDMAKKGLCDVFKYQKDGKTVYLTRQEVKDGVTDHTISGDDASGYTVDGIQLELVVQNKNSAVHNNINTVNTQSEQFKNFVASMPTLAAEYADYAEKVEQAQDEIHDAQEEATALKDAIDDLKNNQTNRVIKAIEVLGVEDLTTYFGLEDLTDDEAAMLNKMTVKQAIKYLDERLDAAKERVETAKTNLEQLSSTKDQIGQILENMQEEESGDIDNPGVPNEPGPGVTPGENVQPDTPIQPVTPAQPDTPVQPAPDAPAPGGTVIINDEPTPQAPTVPSNVISDDNTVNDNNNTVNVVSDGNTVNDIIEEFINSVAGNDNISNDSVNNIIQNLLNDPAAAAAIQNIADNPVPMAAQAPVQNINNQATNQNPADQNSADQNSQITAQDNQVTDQDNQVTNQNVQQPTKTIVDEDPAKAAVPVDAQKKNFSYWWLLILVALAIMADRIRRKMNEEKADETEQ